MTLSDIGNICSVLGFAFTILVFIYERKKK